MALDHHSSNPDTDTPALSPDARSFDASTARARRSLAASRAARDGITSMVDALRISKPPRVPSKPPTTTPSSATTARRHSLIPLAEGRDQLEARIHALEDTLATRDDAIITLKRQLGRSLVKRRHLNREREALSAKLSAAVTTARSFHALATDGRTDFRTLVDDISTSLRAARRDGDSIIIDDIRAALEIATSKLSNTILPNPPDAIAMPLANMQAKGRVVGYAASVGVSDDDAKSMASFTSSAIGEDRDVQLDSLVELVDILDSKLATGPPHAGAANAVAKARRTVANVRARKDVAEPSREVVTRIVDDILSERGSDLKKELKSSLVSEVELQKARLEIEQLRNRLEESESHRTSRNGLAERTGALENELANAKRTITRLIQERQVLRRGTIGASFSALGAPDRTPDRRPPRERIGKRVAGESDAMQRVLVWRQSAGEGEDGQDVRARRPTAVKRRIGADGRMILVTGVEDGSVGGAGGGGGVEDDIFMSEKSLDGLGNDSTSGQSLPVRGFLQRHDSILSGDVMSSTNGDEITIMRHRNIFNVGNRPTDGLRGLLGS